MFAEEPRPFEDEYARRCFRVLRMASILHGKGFHGLRVFPYVYPLAYRVELYPAAFADQDGVKCRGSVDLEHKRLMARYSGASETEYFGWQDAKQLSAHALALLFVERFPELAGATYHLDFAYAGWFATLLAHCEYGYLPYLFGEYEEEIGVMRMRRIAREERPDEMKCFPLPPHPSGRFSLEPRPDRAGWKLNDVAGSAATESNSKQLINSVELVRTKLTHIRLLE
jgi:hypothetical protein